VSFRSTLILIAILFLLGGFIFISEARKPKDTYTEAPEVWSVEEESIIGIDIALPSEEKSVSFVIGKDEYWYFNDAELSPVDLARWGGIVLLVTGPASRRQIADKVAHPEDFGMVKPSLTVKLSLTGRKPLEILVGDPTPNEEHYYIMVKGGDPLYIVHRSWHEVFTRLVREPPHPPVKRVKVPPELEGKL
jgi:hypothetical protein